MTAAGGPTYTQGATDRPGERVAIWPVGAGARSAAPGWMTDAACRGVGIGEFFAPDGRGRRWCRCCPVAECCFWWAMVTEWETGFRFGIWGGATPAVRAQVAGVVGGVGARDRLADALAQWAERAAMAARERRVG
jgi:hypothetical protein